MRRLLAARLVVPTVLSTEKADPPDSRLKPALPPIIAESLRNILLLVDICSLPKGIDFQIQNYKFVVKYRVIISKAREVAHGSNDHRNFTIWLSLPPN